MSLIKFSCQVQSQPLTDWVVRALTRKKVVPVTGTEGTWVGLSVFMLSNALVSLPLPSKPAWHLQNMCQEFVT